MSEKKDKIYHQDLIKKKVLYYLLQLLTYVRSSTTQILYHGCASTPRTYPCPTRFTCTSCVLTAYDTVLEWIGFTIPAQRAAILADITELEDYADLKENHMQSLADGFDRHTVADGRLIVGVSRTKRLTELIPWVSDFKTT